MQVAIVKRAFGGALYCGDECAYWQSGGKIILCVVDGLGHGEYAEKAAKSAVDYVACHLLEPLPEVFAGCDLALRNTRGVVMGIAVVDEGAGTLIYAGVGNTHAMIVRERHPELTGGKILRLSSNYGIIGGGYKTLSSQTAPLRPGDMVILATDGVTEMMDVLGYDDSLRADVQRLAERIIQDWRRGRDDAAVLVFKREAL